jgi:hypothetical protein
MKQTAVEWQHIELSKFLYGKSEFTDANDILIKAKEMEKEQMRLVHKNGYDNSQYRHDCNYGGVEYWDSVPRPFEGYYNETFNSTEDE